MIFLIDSRPYFVKHKSCMAWYKSTGRLHYDDKWLVLRCSNSITAYYGYWCQKLTWKKGSTPFFQAHVTCVAGKYQDVSHHPNWGKYQNLVVDFEYSNIIEYNKQDDGTYYWLPVRCPFLENVRLELGLDRKPKWQYHLTCYFIQR